MTDGETTAALRRMVREVLREVLPSEPTTHSAPAPAPAPSPEAPARSRDDVRRVRVRDDRELADLVTQVLNLAEDPARAADLRTGRIRFRLLDDGEVAATAAPGPIDVARGAVTERLIQRASREHRALRIGPRAVVTPLARDRARALGVTIERTDHTTASSSAEGRETR
jgi:hypothetical protein